MKAPPSGLLIAEKLQDAVEKMNLIRNRTDWPARASRNRQSTVVASGEKPRKLKGERYTRELKKLQIELVKLQEWIKHKGLKVVLPFEGRDAAGKGGAVKRISQRTNPRIFRVVAGMPANSGLMT